MTTQRCDEGSNGQTIDLAVGQTFSPNLYRPVFVGSGLAGHACAPE
jgi:hypothetical protein